MPNCSHCHADLPIETLEAGGDLVCPSCGRPIDLSEEDGNLSSLAEGSPADATMRLGPEHDSSLAGSSLAESEDADSIFSDDDLSADSSDEATIDSAGLASFDEAEEAGFDATLVYGPRPARDDEDDEDDDLEDDDNEQGILLEEEPEGPSESLDATIDFGRLGTQAEARAEGDATIDPAGLAGLGAAGDLTRMLDDDPAPAEPSDVGEHTTDSAQPMSDPGVAHFDATLPVDSDQPDSADAASGSSVFSDSSLERTELPSGTPEDTSDDATLQFDSDIHSRGAETPDALDITGLDSDDTMPRGPLGEGRASASLKPGESMIVGDESVRLRAFELSEADPTGAKEIDYKIEGEAGKGGMGVVYKARQQSLDRLVAIKQIKSDMGASDSDRNKFVSEAVITGQLEHPNIAPVHDLGLAADGLPFYAMKFVEGEDWEDSIRDKTEEENLAILIQVAQAIAFAHSKSILHRDLKPGNVRLGSFGEVLVMDWGLAARLDDGSEIQPAGTPIYMPPETALEYLDYAKGKVVGGRGVGSSRRRVPAGTYCDIYLLGALLFKIVTGRAPHRGKTTFECLRAAAKNDIIKVRRSNELLDIAYRAMATEPEDRYANALDFIEAIRAYQSHAQSILIAKRATKDLRQAGRLVKSSNADATELYALFSSAQNGYQNALDLWGGNRKATRRLKKARRMFAEAAYANGDYDLALSLLSEPNEEDAELRQSIVASQKSRNARVAWFRTLQYATAASLVLALAFIAYSVVAKLDAISARSEAVAEASKAASAKADADQAKLEATKAEQLAADAAVKAKQETERAAAAQVEAVAATLEATEAKEEAAAAIDEASQAKAQLAIALQEADQATEVAKVESYNAAVSEIRATLSDNGVYAAWKTMSQVDPAVAALGSDSPEWRYLTKAVNWQDEASELVGEDPAQPSRPTRLASSADGQWLVAAATSDGKTTFHAYRAGEEAPIQSWQQVGSVRDVAIDRSGRYVASIGSELRLFDRESGQSIPADSLPKDTACVAFHPTSPELLIGTDSSAIERCLIQGGRVIRLDRDARWHQTRVTAVGYSADGSQRFSADRTGRLVVWRLSDGEWAERKTIAHAGAGSPRITAAALTNEANGRLAYGCDDGSVYERFGWWNAVGDAGEPEGGFAPAEAERLGTSHPAAVTDVAYVDQGSTILSAGGDTLLVRRSPTLASEVAAGLSSIRRERRYHDAAVLACTSGANGVAYSSDERGRVVRWRIDTPPGETTLQPDRGASGVAAVQVAPESDRVVVADMAGFVRTWDDLTRTKDSETAYTGHADHRDLRAWHLAGTPGRLVTVAADNRACVWRIDDGLLERTIELGGRTVVAVDASRRTLFAASDGRPIEGASARAWSIDSGATQDLWDTNARVAAIHPLGEKELTLAVGLRDGQVSLWREGLGTIELVRSSGRPHWRPVNAFAYDTTRRRLYSGDTGGLVAAWDLTTGKKSAERLLSLDASSGPASIASLELAGDKGLFVLLRSAKGLSPNWLGFDLSPVDVDSLTMNGLRDAAFDPASGGLLGLRESGSHHELIAWDEPRGWRSVGTSMGGSMEGLRAASEGWLVWGGGRVQWRPQRGGSHPLATLIVSRPRTEAFVASDLESASAITQIGSVDKWHKNRVATQRRLDVSGDLLASCANDSLHQAYVAVAEGWAGSRIELWDTAKANRLRVLATLPSRPSKLAVGGDLVITLTSNKVFLVPKRGGSLESITIPAEAGRAVSVATSGQPPKVAIATSRGSAFLAERQAGGAWRARPLDQGGVSSVAFTPNGERLLVGVESGRVLMLGLEAVVDGVQKTRPVLSLPGHSNRVTLLNVSPTPEGGRIVSGDASGRVVVRSL